MAELSAEELVKDDELNKLVKSFESFLDATAAARINSEVCRDYRDHKQWTEEERKIIEARGQAPIVFNYISRKVNALVGLENLKRTDPKALPRSPKHDKDAESVTDALRYVADNTDFDQVSSESFENLVVEGTGAAIVEVVVKRRDFEIQINHIEWDRFYFDPHSRKKDFSDAKFMGIVVWMDQEDAEAMFPDMGEMIDDLFNASAQSEDSETFQDRPVWIDRTRKRLRVLQHYYKKKGVWYSCFMTRSMFLIEPQPCPYLDEDGEPQCPIVAQSAYRDRENNRYGEVKAMLDPQDEVNHRRSKALHQLSVRQTFGNNQAIVDVTKAKEELAKPDGHVEIEGTGQFGKDFGILPTNDMAVGQMEMLQEAKAELDASSINPALTGRDEQTISGRAIQARQQGGVTEMEWPLMSGHRSWKRRIFRQTWNRIKQFWTEERWVRVTDDEKNVRFVGLNHAVSVMELLQEKAQDTKDPQHQNAALTLETMIHNQDPRLYRRIVRNNVAELDVDILIDEGSDVITIQQEQFAALLDLAKIYGPEAVPFEELVKLSTLRNKERFMESEQEQDPAIAAIQQQQIQNQLQTQQLELEKLDAEVETEKATAVQKNLENEILLHQPINSTNVSV